MTTHVTTQISSTRPVRDDLAGLPATTPPAVHRDRGWALAGLGAAIAGIVGTGGAISINAVYDKSIAGDAPAILDQLGGDVVGMVVFQVGASLCAVLLAVFAVGLFRRLRAVAPADSLAPGLAAFGLLATSVVQVMGTVLNTEFISAAMYPESVVPEAAAMYNHWVGTTPGCWVLGGLAGLAAYAVSRRGGLPRWIGRTGLVLGGLTLLVGISPLQYMAGLTGLLWLLITSVGFLAGDRAFRRA